MVYQLDIFQLVFMQKLTFLGGHQLIFNEDITATIDVFKSIVFDDKNTYKMKVGLERNRKVFIFLQKLFGRMNIDF